MNTPNKKTKVTDEIKADILTSRLSAAQLSKKHSISVASIYRTIKDRNK